MRKPAPSVARLFCCLKVSIEIASSRFLATSCSLPLRYTMDGIEVQIIDLQQMILAEMLGCATRRSEARCSIWRRLRAMLVTVKLLAGVRLSASPKEARY